MYQSLHVHVCLPLGGCLEGFLTARQVDVCDMVDFQTSALILAHSECLCRFERAFLGNLLVSTSNWSVVLLRLRPPFEFDSSPHSSFPVNLPVLVILSLSLNNISDFVCLGHPLSKIFFGGHGWQFSFFNSPLFPLRFLLASSWYVFRISIIQIDSKVNHAVAQIRWLPVSVIWESRLCPASFPSPSQMHSFQLPLQRSSSFNILFLFFSSLFSSPLSPLFSSLLFFLFSSLSLLFSSLLFFLAWTLSCPCFSPSISHTMP